MASLSPDLSQTQRLVFLIDLQPLLHLHDPQSYLSSILRSADKCFSFDPLATSLFAFKFFFSSLSPFLSTSQTQRQFGKSAAFFYFDRPSETRRSLALALESLASSPPLPQPSPAAWPQASLISRSLHQLVHDYAWEPRISDRQGMQTFNSDFTFRSNLILLFSIFPRSMQNLSDFTDRVTSDTGSGFSEHFFEIFGPVSEAFKVRDIHLCWVNVSSYHGGEGEECLGLLEREIKGLGWGFCSTDSIFLGSAVVPFGLIWPNIACSARFQDHHKGYAELVLEIQDVNKKPLQCKCCGLEFVDLKLPAGKTDLSQIWECVNLRDEDSPQKHFWRNFDGGSMKICVKEVRRKEIGVKIENNVRDFVFVRGSSREALEDNSTDFFADKVLKMLRWEKSEFTAGKPMWQILLLFLWRGFYSALVSVSDSNGNSFMGVLEPFTVHSAILGILDSDVTIEPRCDISGNGLGLQRRAKAESDRGDYGVSRSPGSPRQVAKIGSNICDINGNLDQSKTFPASHPACFKCSERKHKYPNELLELTWDAFYESVICCPCGAKSNARSGMNLRELYFSRGDNSSKKLRFLNCWMKQMRKLATSQRAEYNKQKLQEDEEKEARVVSSQQSSQSENYFEQESQHLLSSLQSVGENSSSGFIDNALVSCQGNSESFPASICQKIEQSLCDNEVDLGFLAERLVNSSIHWLELQFEGRDLIENSIPEESENTSDATIAAEMAKLLLKKPKDLAAKYRGYVSLSLAILSNQSFTSDPSSMVCTSENKVREYELQILFRMEILQSKIGFSMEEIAKEKMIKEICLLLEDIQFNLQGGIFGGEDLVKFAERAIKSRYGHTLGDIIHKIYTQMEFHSFDKDGEMAAFLLNEDDEEESRRAEENAGFSGENNYCSEAEEKPHLLESSLGKERSRENCCDNRVYERRLVEAQKNREKARRFAFFTSWVPDLQRVWLPKQQGKAKTKAKPWRRLTEKRKRKRSCNDVVFETPKHAHECGFVEDGKPVEYERNSHCGPVSKALFRSQDTTCFTTCTAET